MLCSLQYDLDGILENDALQATFVKKIAKWLKSRPVKHFQISKIACGVLAKMHDN